MAKWLDGHGRRRWIPLPGSSCFNKTPWTQQISAGHPPLVSKLMEAGNDRSSLPPAIFLLRAWEPFFGSNRLLGRPRLTKRKKRVNWDPWNTLAPMPPLHGVPLSPPPPEFAPEMWRKT